MDSGTLLVFQLIATFIAAYYGAYWAKRGQNAAILADLKTLLTQVSAVTTTTKKIEARISIDVWSRQQRWEVQKAALLDTLKELATAEVALWALVWTFSRKDHDTEEGKQNRKEANEKFSKALDAFWRTKLATSIVCGKEISDRLDNVDRSLAKVRLKAGSGNFGEIWGPQFDEVKAAIRELGERIRKDLDFGPELGDLKLPAYESLTDRTLD